MSTSYLGKQHVFVNNFFGDILKIRDPKYSVANCIINLRNFIDLIKVDCVSDIDRD